MNKYSEGRIPLPKIYCSRRFTDDNKTKGYLIMEYFDDIVPCHLTDNITIEAMKKVLRSIAIWQGIGLKMTEEEKSIYTTAFLSENFGDMFKPEMVNQLKAGLEEFCGPENLETSRQFHTLMLKLCTKEVYAKYDAIPDKLGYKRVFAHGDVWSTNILWTKVDGVLDIKAHIDFQVI
ncbi:unnamed protein product [Auanema sp. JU1783]|nr:unnamed protein product [Auanema sp. JU1783]